jgi:hypothetical protein
LLYFKCEKVAPIIPDLPPEVTLCHVAMSKPWDSNIFM